MQACKMWCDRVMKMKPEIIEILDKINQNLRTFALTNGNLLFNQIALNSQEDYLGSMEFGKFTVYFYFDVNSDAGYYFMEKPYTEDDSVFDKNITLLTRFKFDFSPLAFSPYDIHNIIRSNEFLTLDFHEIQTVEEAEKSLSVILDFIQKNRVLISNIGTDLRLQNELLENYFADQRAMNKKFDKEKFLEDIEDSLMLREFSLTAQIDLQDSIDTFICTGNYSQLMKKSAKLEKRGKLLVFEKRYTDYLAQNGYPQPNVAVKEKRVQNKSKQAWTRVLIVVSLALGGILSLIALAFVEDFFVSKLPDGAHYLTSLSIDLPLILLAVGFGLIFARIAMLIPKLCNKTNFAMWINRGKKGILSIIPIISAVCILLAGLSIVHFQKTEWVYSQNNMIYIDEKPVKKEQIEIIHIEGYYVYDGNDELVYVSGDVNEDYYLVFDGDYDNHILCDNFELYEEFPVIFKALSQEGYTVKSYKDYDEFLNSY